MSAWLTGNATQKAMKKADTEAPPKEKVAEPRFHRARHEEDEPVVDDLHHGDRDGVGGECDSRCLAKRNAAHKQRPQGQQVAEEERQHDGDRDRGDIAPAESRRDHEAQHLSDRAAGQAVPSGGKGGAGERRGRPCCPCA
jgi:hypothetical protein